MITIRRSCRCLRRRHLARISIIDMFGESSMNSGASTTSLIRRASRVQSSSPIWPVRIACSGTRASADSSRMVISFRLISRLKMHRGHPVLDRRRPGEVQCQRRVVRRDHAAASEIQLIRAVDLHAPDRH